MHDFGYCFKNGTVILTGELWIKQEVDITWECYDKWNSSRYF